MEFRDYAAKETSALVARALGEASEESRQRVQAFRSAINAATKALETALGSPPQVDLTELVNRLAKAATAEAEAAAQRVSADAKVEAQRHAAEAKAVIDQLQAQLKAETTQKETLAASLEEVRVQAEELRLELQTDKDRIENARHELASTREAHKKAEAARVEAVAARDKEARVRAAIEGELQTEKQKLESARSELTTARDAHKKVEAERVEAVNARDKEARARAAAQTELEKLGTSLEAARAEARQIEQELDSVRADSGQSARELEAALGEKARLEEAVKSAQSATQAAETKLATLTSVFKTSSARVKALERAEMEHQTVVHDLEDKLTALEQRHEAVITEFEDRLAAMQETHVAEKIELEERLTAAISAETSLAGRDTETISLLDELLGGFQSLASATTIAEVLTTLVRRLAAEFSRVALFRLKGNRLEGQEQLGFDSKTDIGKVLMPIGMDSLMTRAAGSSRIERLTGDELEDSSRGLFGGSPSCALALPIVVHGETLAIVYADDSGRAESERTEAALEMKTRFADALLQHAVALLMRLTTELRTLAELRTYATALLSELEEMYVSDVSAGKADEELQKRLKDNLEYARSIFANRIALECPDAGPLLDDQLAALLDSQQDTPFGRDLAVVAGHSGLSSGSARAAEAS
jgi:hypothetical protein